MSTSNALPSTRAGTHAIVYGGSMAGLMTAGLLSRHFDRITLVERDRFQNGPMPRKGVPQAQHVHGLLTRGMDILAGIFPGIREDIEATGAEFLDVIETTASFGSGTWRPRFRSDVKAASMSRLLLEWVVRQRLQALPNVRILDGREAVGLKTNGERTHVTGLQIQAPGGGQEETLEAELVVDSSGRGSRTPQWLEALGYPRVEETRIHVDVGYASRLYRQPRGFDPGWRSLAIAPRLPKERRIGIIQEIEDDRWLALVGGWLGDAVSTADDAAFLEFARGLPQPHLYEAIKNAEPLGPIHLYRFSHHQRRHYERMPRFPEGLAVVGDAFCSFNPIYGQGMSTGAMQAEALGGCLRQGVRGASNRYRRRAGEILAGPWALATAGDLAFPEVEGKRPPGFDLMRWYGNRFQQLAGYDEETMKTFVQVQHMIESPAAMFSPRMVLKVLTVDPDKATRNPGPRPLSISTQRVA
ncbi:FAD-dependent monooxygenase [Archangium violaceum]|uniref:FAD-dependent oxidoreductase n=1 Tax=Archangium violaceum TaxID=83451 RepID=UPI00194DC2C1|nr:FAD-dependent oxidoreductase [Archangium violaceum]QRN93623.1 FAD-dependent monooxygenase [Archangium violaceum]